jgi:AcrR family transcriptional regulator
MDTKSAILDAALELFNAQGTAQVSTNHIAKAAGISPGNLYYHYRNKAEIIRALFERLFSDWDVIFTLDETRPPTLDDLERLVRANFETLWAYRFAYRELVALLRQDEQLKGRFLEIRARGFQGFAELFQQFVAAGVLPSTTREADGKDIAEMCWLISEFWLPYLEVSNLPIEPAYLERGVQLMLRAIGAH